MTYRYHTDPNSLAPVKRLTMRERCVVAAILLACAIVIVGLYMLGSSNVGGAS